MTVVIDASALAGWVLPDEAAFNLDSLALGAVGFRAPWLLWAEIRNILIVSERRGRIPVGLLEQAIETIEALGIELDSAPSAAQVLDLARRHGLTVYDALYLDLALRTRARLASRDVALIRAAQAEKVTVIRG